MIETVSKEIDGTSYQFTPLMAKAARRQLDKLINNLGPSIASGIKGLQSLDISTDLDEASALPALAGGIGEAAESFCRALTPDYHEELVKTFFAQVRYDAGDGALKKLTPQVCEIHFATSLLTELKVLVFCLEAQYQDFFGLALSAKTLLSSLTSEPTVPASKSENV